MDGGCRIDEGVFSRGGFGDMCLDQIGMSSISSQRQGLGVCKT